ncbi:MAG: peptidylprolyl isomerase [Candidatus Omnitrophota bacterium]|nr:peptidylprolyl isomerase [Candidatus Omnitrophota bacterium]
MKRIAFISVIITVLAALAAPSGAAVVDKIVVVVNNEIITQREVDIMLAPIYGQYRSMYKGEELIRMLEDVREKILKQLIEDRLILSEAKKLNIAIEEKEVDAKIDEMRSKVGSEQDLENMLNEQNLTLNELRARYKEKIMIRKLIDQKVGARIIITPLEVKNYYNDNKDSFMQPEEIRLRAILIKPKKEQGGEAGSLQLIRDLMKRLREGCDFESLAKEYSDDPAAAEGGLMGYVKKGDLMPQIEEIVFKLKEGEITGIIQSPLGYHIFKVEEKRVRRMRELAEVRQDIEEFLYREKASQRLKGWIDSLAKSAYIEFK